MQFGSTFDSILVIEILKIYWRSVELLWRREVNLPIPTKRLSRLILIGFTFPVVLGHRIDRQTKNPGTHR
jgi:hypothetical protein